MTKTRFFGPPAAAKSSPVPVPGTPGGHTRGNGRDGNVHEVQNWKSSIFSKAEQNTHLPKNTKGFFTFKEFFFLGKRRQFACFKNSKDEKLDTGAMVQWLVKNSTRKTCHNFEDCNRKSRCEMDLETNSFVFSLSRFAPWP